MILWLGIFFWYIWAYFFYISQCIDSHVPLSCLTSEFEKASSAIELKHKVIKHFIKGLLSIASLEERRETWWEEGAMAGWQSRIFMGLQYFLGGNYFWENASGSVPLFLCREIECRGSCHSAWREELGLGKNFLAQRSFFWGWGRWGGINKGFLGIREPQTIILKKGLHAIVW